MEDMKSQHQLTATGSISMGRQQKKPKKRCGGRLFGLKTVLESIRHIPILLERSGKDGTKANLQKLRQPEKCMKLIVSERSLFLTENQFHKSMSVISTRL
ncbi:MAG: hypothetical protein IJK53_01875 [Erysipelotrichaceae bacterium]|nr:hypothetical protein [Erysipelotrichaceae bacterium]